MPYYTDLALVFRALDGGQREFDWILTNVDCIAFDRKALPRELRPPTDKPAVYTGAALSDLVAERKIQFVWAVLSGFLPNELPDPESLDPYPFADGNPGFWQPRPSIQHPRAVVEIVSFDSSATLLLSKRVELSRRFRAFFSDAVDLDEYNARRLGLAPFDSGET